MSSSNEKSGSHSLLPWKHTAFKDFLKLAMSVAMEIVSVLGRLLMFHCQFLV